MIIWKTEDRNNIFVELSNVNKNADYSITHQLNNVINSLKDKGYSVKNVSLGDDSY